MQQQKSKKILLYIFLFLMIGTLNNKNISASNFAEIKKINIDGLNDLRKLDLLKEFDLLKFNNLFFLDRIKVSKILSSNELIDKFSVYKNYPSTLNIKIQKAKFVAKIKKDENLFFLGTNGKLIKSIKENYDVPYIFGDLNYDSFFELKKKIDNSNFDYNEIKHLFFFKSGRWDIETKSGILIKLPKSNLERSIELVVDILNENIQTKIYKIDIRQNDQVIIDER